MHGRHHAGYALGECGRAETRGAGVARWKRVTDADDEAPPRERLPDGLVGTLDDLDHAELHAVVQYAQQRLAESHHSIAEDVRAEGGEDVVSIDDRGGYALVRKRQSMPDDPDSDAGFSSLYLVTHETDMDGERSLHWSYLGDMDGGGA